MADFEQISNNLQDDTNIFMKPVVLHDVLYDVLPGINDSDIIKDIAKVHDNDVWGNCS